MCENNKKPNRYAVIMAAGSGSRMNSVLPKPLITVGNKPMIVHLIDNVRHFGVEIILVVAEKTKHIFVKTLVDLNYVTHLKDNIYVRKGVTIHICVQSIANGTGGALIATSEFFMTKEPNDIVLILSGDVPLVTKKTMLFMFDKIETPSTKCVILVKNIKNTNCGYGRVITKPLIRNENKNEIENEIENKNENEFVNIVEEIDCTNEQKEITLVNTGIYVFKIGPLLESLRKLTRNNSQKEYYLTDCPRLINDVMSTTSTTSTTTTTSTTLSTLSTTTINNPIKLHINENTNTCFDETIGANTPEQLELLRAEYYKKFRIEKITDSETNTSNTNIRNLLRVLEQLSPLKSLTSFCQPIANIDEIRHYLLNSENCTFNKKTILVVKFENVIIGTGSVLIEEKLIHNMGRVSHIEDIVIDIEYRGLGLAKLLMIQLIKFSKKQDCYKIILDASDNIKGFYEKLGFKHHANSMRLDLN